MNERISELLADAHHSLREQLAAAEVHFQRLEGALAARESKEIASLNRAARRLRQSGQAGWTGALVEATQGFSDRAALFAIRGNTLHLEAAQDVPADAPPDVPLDSAPAFRSVADTRDTVVALRTSGELSAPIASYLGEGVNGRSYLFPVAAREQVVAVLYTDGEPGSVQTDALELLTTVAGAVLEGRPALSPNGLVSIAEAAVSNDLPSALSAEERDLHLRAQRFARVQAADMRLYKSDDVKNGRAAFDLYSSLREEIDSAREMFRRNFLSGSEGMVDYLHLELVHTLANGEVELLGPNYPGPMV
ncbi:MAG TPA: hypothetical protein VEV17_24585 [Bryobacteraceae bacterium]|nr:hypothetical protein [Bryobacteraceae bacterium]